MKFVVKILKMNKKNIIIQTKDGYQLVSILKEPDSQPIKSVVQIQCCTGIKQSFYTNYATHLTQNGYITLTFDYWGIENPNQNLSKELKMSYQMGIVDVTYSF